MNRKLSFFINEKMKVSYIFAIALAALMHLPVIRTYAQSSISKVAPYDEYGLFLGAGYYNGEINPSAPMYKPKLCVGFNMRHVFNERLALSFQALRCKLEGSDKDFASEYQKARNASFENEIIELSLHMEFNFLPLLSGDEYRCFTPYISAGPGMAIGSFVNEGLRFCIPFGVGVKYSPKKGFTLSAEWKYRKLFSDMLDGIPGDKYDMSFGDGAAKQKSFIDNDDWYSFIGVVFSFSPQRSKSPLCSAYN